MSEYHEPYEELDPETRDSHRAIKSLMEELEAVDWYSQRIAVCQDPQLRDVLAHNRDEEIEHACMALEWLRRRVPGWDDNLREYLFKEGPIRDASGEGGGVRAARDLGIGSLRPAAPAGKD